MIYVFEVHIKPGQQQYADAWVRPARIPGPRHAFALNDPTVLLAIAKSFDAMEAVPVTPSKPHCQPQDIRVVGEFEILSGSWSPASLQIAPIETAVL